MVVIWNRQKLMSNEKAKVGCQREKNPREKADVDCQIAGAEGVDVIEYKKEAEKAVTKSRWSTGGGGEAGRHIPKA